MMNVKQGSEEKRELPPGWRWAELSELGIFESGGTPPKDKADYWNGVVPFMTGADITELYLSSRHARAFLSEEGIKSGKTGVCPPGTVLLVTRTRVGRAGIANELMAVSQDINPFFCGGRIHPEYLARYLACISGNLIANCRGAIIKGLTRDYINKLLIPLPPISEQKRIAGILNERMAAIDKARAAAEAQLAAVKALQFSYVKESLSGVPLISMPLSDCLLEVTKGIGTTWSQYAVLGATRYGLSLAKEKPGKHPERYKPVTKGTIFYNPMRILIGSIAYVADVENEGITSPDYVVFKTKTGILHYQWFYHWLKSPLGDEIIRSLARGAVRERMLFNRLSEGIIKIPRWEVQLSVADRIRSVLPLIGHAEAQLSEINALPQALLRQAFNGEL